MNERYAPPPVVGDAASLPPAYALPAQRVIRRARGYYLYDDRGTRFLDMWLDDGAALLGHRVPAAARAMAAETSRGLWTALPTRWPRRLRQQLAQLAAAHATPPVDRIALALPGYGASDARPRRWYPLGEVDFAISGDGVGAAEDLPASQIVAVVPPLPGWGRSVTVGPTPSDGPVASPVAAALVAAIGALRRALRADAREAWLIAARSLPLPDGLIRDGVHFVVADDALAARWTDLVARGVELGIILPPAPTCRGTIPPDLSLHERRQWDRLWHA